jgi:hypothetical protein
MSRSQSVAFRLGGALCVVAVAACAAAGAHVAIDALGDVLLPHDTYDDIAHDSRTVTAAAAVAFLLAAGARSIFVALRSAIGRRSAQRAFRIASPLRFVITVAALAVPLVLAMEALDAFAAGRAVDDLGDLFGGSIVLGLGTTVGVALAVAAAACAGLRFFCSTRALLVSVVAGLFQKRAAAAPVFTWRSRRRDCLIVPTFDLRHAAERGPPILG